MSGGFQSQTKDRRDGDRAAADSRRGLMLMLEGALEPGLKLYENALKTPSASNLQTGLHLLLLERAGKTEDATRLRELALRHGGNIILKGVALEADLGEAAEEYEQHLDQGLFNTRMIESYLMLLMRMGKFERMADLCDQNQLLRMVRVGGSDPEALALAASIEECLLRYEADATYQEADQSVRNQRLISPLHKLREPPINKLLARLQEEARAYLSDWSSSSHPLAKHVPRHFRLDCWGLISRGEGFNIPHIHQRGWATGVYYPTGIAEDSPGGDLCVGPPEAVAHAREGWPVATIRPEAGLLVLMPSFFTHWTTPLGAPGLRIAVAFDVAEA